MLVEATNIFEKELKRFEETIKENRESRDDCLRNFYISIIEEYWSELNSAK